MYVFFTPSNINSTELTQLSVDLTRLTPAPHRSTDLHSEYHLTAHDILHCYESNECYILTLRCRSEQIAMAHELDIFNADDTCMVCVILVTVSSSVLHYTCLDTCDFIADIYTPYIRAVVVLSYESAGIDRSKSEVIIATHFNQLVHLVNGDVIHCLDLNVENVTQLHLCRDYGDHVSHLIIQGHHKSVIVETETYMVS